MEWLDYLSLLQWQKCRLSRDDFSRLEREKIQRPEEMAGLVSSPETREHLIQNKLWWKKAEADYKLCRDKNYQLLYPGKQGYPERFSQFLDSVPVFLCLGNPLCIKDHFPITFVGSRQGDETAFNWLDFHLPPLLNEKRICVVSGGARGLDQKAHTVAIRSKKPTVCFLPSGLDCFYPESLTYLKTGVLDCGGAFLSCFPPWAEMRKAYFYVRNELMSIYSYLTVILQAQIRSGTMLTAQKSLKYGIPIATLPGPPLACQWTGNLQLLYDGAFLIRDRADLSILVEGLSCKKMTYDKAVPELPML